jgi:ankyrin repeat protein
VTETRGFGEREVAYLLEVLDLARRGQTDQLEVQLAAGISVNLTNDVGDTLLILAAYHAHLDTVEMLLRSGADHARTNRRGQSALSCAVFRRDCGIVTALLAAGADSRVGAQSALDIARFFGLEEMADLLALGDFTGSGKSDASLRAKRREGR